MLNAKPMQQDATQKTLTLPALATPSERLNWWLDQHDWPDSPNERAIKAALEANVAKSTSRSWLRENVLPRTAGQKIEAAKILAGISVIWWEHGSQGSAVSVIEAPVINPHDDNAKVRFALATASTAQSIGVALDHSTVNLIMHAAIDRANLLADPEPCLNYLHELILIAINEKSKK